ncbi:acyltransferase family protein [Pengzhenrongella sicca]|uniref:Acyltransferase n=1 Tax=Pengzhenrongella sicca TaxID=2819238 RepID=A0A8A4ZH91_9MICO|nr:acyltransferase family protein [Pengzhenrongella sicca]QTE30349.1 acyltransferase [Pengzhenrongella sicca]
MFLPEVHALRALAITLVVAYHLVPAALPGGFVGVDVFFVISGFLMTRQMRAEIDRTGRLHLAGFYARRARRILPAAVATIVVVVAAGLALLPSTRWAELSAQARASTWFWQNWQLAASAVDYQTQGQAPTALQHFWSLAVEEQFYLIWPLFLIAVLVSRRTHPVRPRTLARAQLATGAVIAGSFAISVAWTATGSPDAYFATPTRLWELAAGALLALRPATIGRTGMRVRAAASWAGLAAIATAAIAYDSSTPFPGAGAALPVVGACLIIGAGANRTRASFAALARLRPVSWLADISYSLYLWHWPVVVLWPDTADPSAAVAAAQILAQLALSVVLASLSRKFVELPTQRCAKLRSAPSMTGLVAVVALTVSTAVAFLPAGLLAAQSQARAHAVEEFWATPPPSLGAEAIDEHGYRALDPATDLIVPDPNHAREDVLASVARDCKGAMSDGATPRCEFGATDATTTIALVGDSHAEQYLPALQILATQNHWRVITYLHASCPFSSAQRVTDHARGGPCLRANAATLTALEADPSIDLVVTAQRTAVPFVTDGTTPDPAEGFNEYWNRLAEAGLAVLAIRDNPMMLPDDQTQACVAQRPDDPASCARRQADALPDDAQVEAARHAPAVTLVDLTNSFCVNGLCPPVIGNVLVYRDDQHLTATYVRTLAPHLDAAIACALSR